MFYLSIFKVIGIHLSIYEGQMICKSINHKQNEKTSI